MNSRQVIVVGGGAAGFFAAIAAPKAAANALVAEHLLKTVSAIRLMGADCIISGIRPQIAQTIVHLGIDLQGIITKATLADALSMALARNGYTVSRGK